MPPNICPFLVPGNYKIMLRALPLPHLSMWYIYVGCKVPAKRRRKTSRIKFKPKHKQKTRRETTNNVNEEF